VSLSAYAIVSRRPASFNSTKAARIAGLRKARAGIAIAAAIWLLAMAAAIQRAWVADDAYITFRYVAQFLAGNGLVYNAGERVEGFTHPLWALLLCGAGLAGIPPAPAALAISLVCAGVLLLLALRADLAPGRPPVSLALALLVCCSGFIDFATSGLETALGMLLVYLAYRESPVLQRGRRVGFSLGLAYLCHPDIAVLALGPTAAALAEYRSGPGKRLRELARYAVALAAAPLAYHAFRLAYYGELLPNSYYAKNGGPYWSQGFAYAVDFLVYAPVAAAGLLLLVGLAVADVRHLDGVARLRKPLGIASIALHVLAMARLGGDFMGFRLLLPDLAAMVALLGGSRIAFTRPLGASPRLLAQATLLAVCAYAILWAPPPPRERGLIVNERLVYRSAYRAPQDAFVGRPDHLWWRVGRQLAQLQQCVGEPRLLVDWPNIGFFAYAAGTKASVIDGVGLVDRFVARNWVVRAGRPRGRPGHEGKMTLDYAIRRGVHVTQTPFESYNAVMNSPLGVLVTLDPRIVCAFPGKAERLRRLKAELLASDDNWDRRTLELVARLEQRDRVRVESLCSAGEAANCRAAMAVASR
jgi:arabinofuranosyltransferase